jgi:hypothetical protein
MSLLLWRVNCWIWPSYNQERGTSPSGPLWILEAPYFSSGCYSSQLTKWPEKLLAWSMVQNKWRLCNRCQLLGTSASWALWPGRPHSASKVSVAGREAVWTLWQAPLTEWQCKSLGFWSKALPFSADNYSSLEKPTALGLLMGISRSWKLNHGSPSYHNTWVAIHFFGTVPLCAYDSNY